MNTSKKVDLLYEKINEQINGFSLKRRENKKKAFYSTIIVVFLSILTTVLLGLQGLNNDIQILFKNIALVASALVSLFNTYEAFYKHKELWISYTETSNRLKALKTDLDYIVACDEQKIIELKIDEIYDRFCSILNKVNSNWEQMRKKDNLNENKK